MHLKFANVLLVVLRVLFANPAKATGKYENPYPLM